MKEYSNNLKSNNTLEKPKISLKDKINKNKEILNQNKENQNTNIHKNKRQLKKVAFLNTINI